MIEKFAKIPLLKKVVKGTFLYDIVNKISDRISPNGLSKYKIKKLINRKAPVVLEIGTNDGADSVAFFQIIPDVRMYCFEPHPGAAERFRRRIAELKKRKKLSCSFFEVAISDKDGNAGLITLPDDYCFAASSLKNSIGKKTDVRTMRLDSWYNKNKPGVIDFIWADVEGCETELITGGKNTLNDKTRYFYTEFSGNQKLKEIGLMLPKFELVGVFDNNALFKNKEVVK